MAAAATTADPLSGVGTPSYTGIEAAAKKSGEVPPLIVTQAVGAGGYHLTGNAVDFSNGGDAGTPEMDKFAAWVASNYGPVSLEIIHVNQDGSTVEWKNGVKQTTGFYGAGTLAQHHNHVHWAITNAGLGAGGTSATGTGAVAATTVGLLHDLNPANWVGDAVKSIFKPLIEFAIEAGMIIGGLVCLFVGLTMLAKQTNTGAAVIKTAGSAVGNAGKAAAVAAVA